MYVSGIELAAGCIIEEDVFAAFRSLFAHQQDHPEITKIVCQELWEESVHVIIKTE